MMERNLFESRNVEYGWSDEVPLSVSNMTMAKPVSILMYGKDSSLLDTRQWLLQASGYQVRTTMNLSDIERMASEESVDLLILCHSLPVADTGRAVALVLSKRPSARTLILATHSSNHSATALEVVLNAAEGPAKLLSTVDRLVGPQSNPHSHVF